MNSVVAFKNIPTELLQEQVNALNQKAYVSNKDTCLTKLTGPEGLCWEYLVQKQNLKVGKLVSCSGPDPQLTEWCLACDTARGEGIYLRGLDVGSQELLAKVVQVVARVAWAWQRPEK